MKKRRYAHVEDLRNDFQSRVSEIRARLEDFRRVPPDEYFYELAYCLLTPQSSAVNAALALQLLRQKGCFDRPDETAEVLHRKAHYIRFHNTKAIRLAEAWMQFPLIEARLGGHFAARDLRDWLVEHVKGLGWKEASHFLRNIGYRDLAILDRHILKNLKWHGVLRAIPKTLSPARYCAIEKKFAWFAHDVGITMDELDLLFWSRETGKILK
jgi:N-glycosylase/DNA lyase